MENVVKSGYLECFVRGIGGSWTFQWQKRFYVLYGASANNQGRLDYYDNEDAYKVEPKVRKTIYLEEVQQAQREQDAEREHVFSLAMCRTAKRSYRFAAPSEEVLNEWLRAVALVKKHDCSLQPPAVDEPCRVLIDQNVIYESLQDLQQFPVMVAETEAAKRCHLKVGTSYDLFVLPEYLCLAEANKRILTWSYKHIRRYGCGENNFTFEAGRKSLSGEGLFSFMVVEGQKLFRNVQDRMKHMQLRQNPEKDEFSKLLLARSDSNNHSGEVSPTIVQSTNSVPLLPVRRTSGGSGEALSHPLPPKPKPLQKAPIPPKPKPPQKVPHEKKAAKPMLNSDFQLELKNTLRPKCPDPAERKASLGSPTKLSAAHNPMRVSTGENYELAKSNLPPTEIRRPLPNYCETSEQRELDPSYSDTKLNSQSSEPQYFDYDFVQSARFKKKRPSDAEPEDFKDVMETYSVTSLPHAGDAWRTCGVITDGPDDDQAPPPIYDTPAVAEVEPPKMSAILAKLNRMKPLPQDNEYDYIGKPAQANIPDAASASAYYDHVVSRP